MTHDPKQLDEIRGAFGALKGESEKPAHPAGGLRDMLIGRSGGGGFVSLQERFGYERGVADIKRCSHCAGKSVRIAAPP